MSRKTERLVNLTIALLATKRYLTKSEIFRSVDGYEGSADSKERMFERDKDDLRNLGIDIEVGSFDPLFEDEAGYRIRPDNYQIQLGDLSGRDISLLSLAAEAWRGAALNGSALSALRKLHAIGIESDLESIPDMAPHANIYDKNLQLLITSITERRKIAFSYIAQDLSTQEREIAPYAVASKYGYWYLHGKDLEKNSYRSFRLDRIAGEITSSSKADAFEVDSAFDLTSFGAAESAKSQAHIYLRVGRAFGIRNRSKILDSSIPGWELHELFFHDQERMIEEILWYGDDVVVKAPKDLREEVISRVKHGVELYG